MQRGIKRKENERELRKWKLSEARGKGEKRGERCKEESRGREGNEREVRKG